MHWIEGTDHRNCRERGLGKLSPVDCEATIKPRVALAAQTNESADPQESNGTAHLFAIQPGESVGNTVPHASGGSACSFVFC